MTQPTDAASGGGTPSQPPGTTEPESGALPRRLASADVVAIVVAAVFALLAVARLLPEIPWDDVNIPTITW